MTHALLLWQALRRMQFGVWLLQQSATSMQYGCRVCRSPPFCCKAHTHCQPLAALEPPLSTTLNVHFTLDFTLASSPAQSHRGPHCRLACTQLSLHKRRMRHSYTLNRSLCHRYDASAIQPRHSYETATRQPQYSGDQPRCRCNAAAMLLQCRCDAVAMSSAAVRLLLPAVALAAAGGINRCARGHADGSIRCRWGEGGREDSGRRDVRRLREARRRNRAASSRRSDRSPCAAADVLSLPAR